MQFVLKRLVCNQVHDSISPKSSFFSSCQILAKFGHFYQGMLVEIGLKTQFAIEIAPETLFSLSSIHTSSNISRDMLLFPVFCLWRQFFHCVVLWRLTKLVRNLTEAEKSALGRNAVMNLIINQSFQNQLQTKDPYQHIKFYLNNIFVKCHTKKLLVFTI